MKTPDKEAGSKEVDDYIAGLPIEQNILLEALRNKIKGLAPWITERISWGMPIFYHQGKQLVGYAAFKKHCSFFAMSYSVMDQLKDEIRGFLGAKATLHFSAEKPLPDGLLEKMISARIVEINEGINAKK